MASVRQDKVQVVLDVKAEQAKTELDNLSRKAAVLTGDLKNMKRGTDEYIATNKELSKTNTQIGALRQTLGTAGMSINQLEKYSRELNREMKQLTPGTESFINKSKELRQVETRLGEVRRAAKGIETQLEQTKGGFGGFVSKVTTMLGPVGTMLAGTFAISKVFDFLGDSTAKFNTQAQAVAQLEATLQSTGEAAGFTSKELQDMASQLQGKTLFGDEATIQAQALLLTFTDIKKGVFEEAMPAIQDMAQKMAGDGPADLKGATIQVGKALNDPIKGITALSKVGVSFTAEQRATVARLVEMGDKASAQKLILAELNKEFGGSAEAARKAGTGGWTAFMNTVGDVQELLGEKVNVGLNVLSNFLLQVLDRSEPVVAVFRDFWGECVKLWDQLSGVANSLGFFNEEGSFAQTVVDALAFVFNRLLIPIKVAVQVIGGIVGGFVALYNSSESLRGMLGGLGATFAQVFTNIKDAAVNALGGVADLLVGIFTMDLDKIKSGLSKGFEVVKATATGFGAGVADAYSKGYENQKDKLIDTTAKVKPQEVEAAKKRGAALGETEAKSESEAAKKTREKAAAERKKTEDKLAKDRLDAQKKIEDLLIQQMEDESERKISSAELAASREMASLVGTKQQIADQTRLIEDKLAVDIAKIRADAFAEEDRRMLANSKAVAEANAKITGSATQLELLQASKSAKSGKGTDIVSHQAALITQLEAERQLRLQKAEESNRERLAQDLKNLKLTGDEKIAFELQAQEALNAEKLVLEEEFGQQREEMLTRFAEANRARQIGAITDAAEYMQQAIGHFSDFQKIHSDRELQRLEQDKQKRLTSLQAEHNQGRISKEQFEAQKVTIESGHDTKSRAIKKKAAEDEKKANIANAIIAGILAVIKAAPNIPLQISTGIAAALGVAKMIATPLPTFGQGGMFGRVGRLLASPVSQAWRGIRKYANGGTINPRGGVAGAGQLHGNGGIKMVDGATGEHLGEWEKGEAYMILSRDTVRNNGDVINRLLDASLHRGGSRVKMAKGGLYADGGVTGAVPAGDTGAADFGLLVEEVRGLRSDVQAQKTLIKAYVVATEVESELEEISAIREESAV